MKTVLFLLAVSAAACTDDSSFTYQLNVTTSAGAQLDATFNGTLAATFEMEFPDYGSAIGFGLTVEVRAGSNVATFDETIDDGCARARDRNDLGELLSETRSLILDSTSLVEDPYSAEKCVGTRGSEYGNLDLQR